MVLPSSSGPGRASPLGSSTSGYRRVLRARGGNRKCVLAWGGFGLGLVELGWVGLGWFGLGLYWIVWYDFAWFGSSYSGCRVAL